MKVYIASPVRPVLERCRADGFELYAAWGLVSLMASNGCKTIKELGHTPLSPILAFDGVYSEYEERERIDQACEELLLSCDAIYVVETDYNKDSKGIARELEIAKAHNIPILGV